MTPGRTRRVLLAIAVAVVGLVVATGCGGSSAQLIGIQRDPAPEVGSITLPTTTGEDFPFVAPDGGVLLVYFGYTHCPDICPTTLSDVGLALDDLGDDAAGIELAMATIDPDRDTDDVLSGYVSSFVDGAMALRTDDQDLLRTATSAFGADYIVTPVDGDEPEVGHTTSLYAVDDEGRLVLTWPFGTTVDDLTGDLRILLDRA